jgi:hypothetical protein
MNGTEAQQLGSERRLYTLAGDLGPAGLKVI